MGQKQAYLAIDLGAESGRIVKGILADDKLRLEEVNRFPNGMVPIGGHYHWNLIRLYETMIEAFKICAQSFPMETFIPQQSDQWDQHYERFMGLKAVYTELGRQK